MKYQIRTLYKEKYIYIYNLFFYLRDSTVCLIGKFIEQTDLKNWKGYRDQ